MFSYSAFHNAQVINMGLESVITAAASWQVTVLICAPVTTWSRLFVTFSVNLSVLTLFLYQKRRFDCVQ
jgi:hypothetical protein